MAEQSQINKLDRILKQKIEDMDKATEANLISVPPRAGAESGNGSAPAGSRRKPERRLRQQELIIRERAETIQGTAAVTIRTLLHSLKTDGIHRNRVVPKEFPMVSRGRMMMCL